MRGGYGLIQTVAPAVEPFTTDEMKLHLREDDTAQDDVITGLITAARVYAETSTKRSLITQTWLLTLDYFPGFLYGSSDFEDWPLFQDIIRLPRASPLQSVSSIKYYDPTLTLQTLDPTLYQVDLNREPARVRPAVGRIWPVTYAGYFGAQLGSVQVTYVAGYGAAGSAVPPGIKAAMKLMVAHWYENREAASTANLTTVPMAVDSLLSNYTTGQYS